MSHSYLQFKKYKKSFKDLSYSEYSELHASNSEELALESDKFKLSCCKKRQGIKSVDAISFNNDENFLFIEFKIKKLKRMEDAVLAQEVFEKITSMFKCFQHHIDQDNEITLSNIECWLVYTVNEYSHREYNRYVALGDAIKENLEKVFLSIENLNFNCCESEVFDKNIHYFKMHEYVKNSNF